MPEGQKNGRGGLGGNTLQRLSRSNEEVAMTELEWIERAVEAYKHLGAHGRALLHDHVGGGKNEKRRGRGVRGYWLQMSAVQRKNEMRRRGLIT
mgnify:CR=1 FL=1